MVQPPDRRGGQLGRPHVARRRRRDDVRDALRVVPPQAPVRDVRVASQPHGTMRPDLGQLGRRPDGTGRLPVRARQAAGEPAGPGGRDVRLAHAGGPDLGGRGGAGREPGGRRVVRPRGRVADDRRSPRVGPRDGLVAHPVVHGLRPQRRPAGREPPP
ncbi:hypothetical protein THAOC_29467, partial [Thalassiosira oceanica]